MYPKHRCATVLHVLLKEKREEKYVGLPLDIQMYNKRRRGFLIKRRPFSTQPADSSVFFQKRAAYGLLHYNTGTDRNGRLTKKKWGEENMVETTERAGICSICAYIADCLTVCATRPQITMPIQKDL